MSLKRFILFFLVALIFSSCSNTKHLGANQNLFIGSSEKIKSTEKISKGNKKALQEEMHSLVRPKPNSKVLGIRFKLTVYNLVDTPKKDKGLKYWLKYKVGEPPVIASAQALEKNRQVIQNHLDNKGYFKDSVTMDTSVRNKKLRVTYTANVGAQYIIRQTTFPLDSSVLSKNIQAITKRYTTLKPKRPYDLDVIKDERTRLDARLKERCFFYFNPDYFLADVDSTVGAHKVDIHMLVKPQTPIIARQVYYINDVVVFANYNIHSDTSLAGAKKYQGYTIIDPENKFNPNIFSRTLVFKPGDIYNRTDHNLSLNRLVTLGVYKFVKVRFERTDSALGNKLNAFYYLTPTNKKSLRFQVSGLTKSNNATGGELSINWRNRNLLKGAELLTITASVGAQQQISSGINVGTRTAGIEANLYVPRILAPFHLNTGSAYVPQTRFRVGYELFNRTSQYLLTSIVGSYGYVWKNSITNEQQFNPFVINYVQAANITDSFKNAIDTNLALKRSIENQFIIGSNYNYNYTSLAKPNYNRNNFYFNGNVDVSGNLLGLISGANVNKGKQKEIFNTPFSQYVRLEADFRHYLRLGRYRSFNTRLLGGIGYAYGNNERMPFIKEFFAGGASDLRAFRARTLGPGSYYAGNPRDSFVVDQPGDIKLLMSLEYRDRLFSIVRYALFTDIGNIWTRKEDSSRLGSKFNNHFLDQAAVGVGAGLRFDISILVLRLDISFPLRLPYLPAGSRSNPINFGSSEWRKNNLIYNLAIGYPF